MSRRGKGEGAIYQRKDGRWAGTITLDPIAGKRQRKSFYGKTRAEVAKKLTGGLKAQNDNLPIPGERETVGAFLDAWLEESAATTLRPRTLVSYSMIIERHLKPVLGRIVLAKLGPEAIQRYMNGKRAEGLSNRTVQYHHAILRRALGQAERWGKVARNAAKLTSPPKVEHSEVRPLSPEQARSLLLAIAEDRHAALYSLALGLGLRQGELLGLSWSNVDLDVGTVSVNHTLQYYGHEFHLDPPKTERSRRTIALPTSLVQLLKTHRNKQIEERLHAGPMWEGDRLGLVFTTKLGRPLYGTHLTKSYQALLARLGLPAQRFHDLRHAAATFMLAQGVDLRVVMEVLGHSQIAVTANTHAHVRVEATRAATERIEALLSR